MPAVATQVAPAQEAGRPQPQTTVEPAGGPFIRHSQPGKRAMYSHAGVAFGGQVTDPLVAVPGYLSRLRLRIQASGGVGGASNVQAQADAPYNVAAVIQLKDAFGTPIISGPGYEMLFLVPMLSGAHGLFGAALPSNLPSWSAMAVGAGASGNFTFSTALPFEFAKGYGVISGANASLLPTLQMQLNPAASVYTVVQATTVPTIQVDVNADFYWLPDGVNVEPPGLGTTQQWVLQQGNPSIGSAATATVALPRLGGYLSTLILVMRDATGARIDTGWPTRMRVLVDGVPMIDARVDELQDDFYNVFGGIARPTGVQAISRKTSLSQISLGLLDTGETFLSTNPGTLIQIEGSPWGTVASPPATLSVIAGQVVPAGSLIQGIPEA